MVLGTPKHICGSDFRDYLRVGINLGRHFDLTELVIVREVGGICVALGGKDSVKDRSDRSVGLNAYSTKFYFLRCSNSENV
jgi:hypothetical protein